MPNDLVANAFQSPRWTPGLQADEGDRVAIAAGWDSAGRLGVVAGPQFFFDQWWCPVKWDDSGDPDLHKSAGLELPATAT